MMMRLAIVLALAVGAFAGCFLQEDFTCVRKDAVRCGGEFCHGHCDVSLRKSCDTKVWFKNVCHKEDYCKKIEVPCGNDGLTCGSGEECIADQKCKLIPAHRRSAFAGWRSSSRPGGLFEVCKDVYHCAAVDPWGLDIDEIDVVCKKEYKIVDDMDCDGLFGLKKLWGGVVITQDRFFKLNRGFSCGEKLVGRVVCLEADASIKAEYCGETLCDPGYECATKEICTEVAVEEPICARKPVYTCLNTSSGSLCGNQICSAHEKCEIISNTVCTQNPQIPVPVPGPVVNPAPVPVQTPIPTPSSPASATSVSSSIANQDGTDSITEAITYGDAVANADALAIKGDTSSSSLSEATQGSASTLTDAIATNGDVALADGFAKANP